MRCVGSSVSLSMSGEERWDAAPVSLSCLPDIAVWGRALRGLQVINLELPCTMLSKDICQIRRIKHVLDLTDY